MILTIMFVLVLTITYHKYIVCVCYVPAYVCVHKLVCVNVCVCVCVCVCV